MKKMDLDLLSVIFKDLRFFIVFLLPLSTFHRSWTSYCDNNRKLLCVSTLQHFFFNLDLWRNLNLEACISKNTSGNELKLQIQMLLILLFLDASIAIMYPPPLILSYILLKKMRLELILLPTEVTSTWSKLMSSQKIAETKLTIECLY